MKRKTNWGWIIAIFAIFAAAPQVLFFWLAPFHAQAVWVVYGFGTALTVSCAVVICWTVTKCGLRKGAAPTIAAIFFHVITVLLSVWMLAIDSPVRGVVCMYLFGPGFLATALMIFLIDDAASGPQPHIVDLSANRAEPQPVGRPRPSTPEPRPVVPEPPKPVNPEAELIPIEPPIMPDFEPDYEPDFPAFESDFDTDDSTLPPPPLPPRC